MKMIRRQVGIAWVLWVGVVACLVGGCASSGQMRTQADDHYRLAQSYLSNESHLLAEQEIRKALTLRPDDARYLACLALIHQMQVYQAQGTLHLTRLQLAHEAYRAALRQPDALPSVFGRLMLMPTLVSGRCSWKRGGKTRLGWRLSVSLRSLLGVLSPLMCGSNLNPLSPSGRVVCQLILTPLVAIYARSVNGNRCH